MPDRYCCAVIVLEDATYSTRWRLDKPAEKLGRDEFPAIHMAIKAAQRFIRIKKLKPRRIDASYITPRDGVKPVRCKHGPCI